MKKLWYIKCVLPLPHKDVDRMDPKIAGKVLAGGLTAMAGPVAGVTAAIFADMFEIAAQKLDDEFPYKMESPNQKPRWNQKTSVFLKKDFGYTTGDGKEMFVGWGWMNTPMKATSYETREAAETEAFTFFALCPWFFGRLEIISLRATWLSS